MMLKRQSIEEMEGMTLGRHFPPEAVARALWRATVPGPSANLLCPVEGAAHKPFVAGSLRDACLQFFFFLIL